MTNLHIVESQVLDEKNGYYRLKISVLDIGMYVFGFRASKSSKSGGGWWVQPPSTNTSSGWKQNPEFDKKKPLWLEIEKSCIDAVHEYDSHKSKYLPNDSELTEESIAFALDKVFEEKEPSGLENHE